MSSRKIVVVRDICSVIESNGGDQVRVFIYHPSEQASVDPSSCFVSPKR